MYPGVSALVDAYAAVHSLVEAVRGIVNPEDTVGVNVCVEPNETTVRPIPVAVPVAKV
jgi:hypothetical protein